MPDEPNPRRTARPSDLLDVVRGGSSSLHGRLATSRPRVVIVGGGFAGLYAARGLARAPADVVLVDRTNYHVFQPLLYQVATAGLSAADIGAPIRHALRRQRNVTVVMARATAVDIDARRVQLDDGAILYDRLIVATGARNHYFGHDQWRPHAPGLKTFDDALEIRRRILTAYETAERLRDPAAQRPWLTFVIIGAGTTGVELAGALAEIARHTLARNFRNFDPGTTRVVLLESGERVLPTLSEASSDAARRQLLAMGVEVRTGSRAEDISPDGVQLGDELIEARTVVWAAGVKAERLGETLGAPLDDSGRVRVDRFLQVPGRPEVSVIGDAAAVVYDGRPVPGMAPAAIQMGRCAAANVSAQLAGRHPRPFRYRDAGALATIGRSAAVAELGRLRLAGLVAWILWVVVHVSFLIGFRNRFVVMFEWAWAWVTFQRSARVILGDKRQS